jgi:TonB family protein
MTSPFRCLATRCIAAWFCAFVWGAAGAADPADGGGQAADHVEPMPPMVVGKSQDWDEVTSSLAKLVESAHAADAALGQDVDGHTLGQYADDWLMTQDVQQQLAALKETALAQEAAGDTGRLKKTLDETNRILAAQRHRAIVLVQYSFLLDRLLSHQALIDALAARAAPGEKAASLRTTTTLAQGMQERLIRALNIDDAKAQREVEERWAGDVGRVLDSYNAERLRLAGIVSASERAQAIAPRGRDRRVPCPPQPKRTSGRSEPAIDRASVFAPEYPVTSRRMSYSGTVVLTFHVSASGCMTRSEIYKTTGVDELDDAALAWGEAIRFMPAEKDGKPVDGAFEAAVTFKLTD